MIELFPPIDYILRHFDDVLVDLEFPQSLKREVLAACAHIGLETAAALVKNSPKEDDKPLWRSCAIYYASLENLLVGGRTQAFVYLHNPDLSELSLLDTIRMAVLAEGHDSFEDILVYQLLQGHSVSPGKIIANTAIEYSLTNPP